MCRAPKFAAVGEIEAVIGRELTQRERDALYAMPGGIERLNASQLRMGPMRRDMLRRAAELTEEADGMREQAKALRGVARALSAHRGVSGEDWASLISVCRTKGAAECPACGAFFEPASAGPAECPQCGAEIEARPLDGSWVTSVGPDGLRMADVAAVAKNAAGA